METINLNISDRYVSVSSESVSLQRRADSIIDQVTKAQPEGVHWIKQNRPGWDGFIRLYRNNRFPTGLLDRVYKELIEYEIPLEFSYDDNFTHWNFKDDIDQFATPDMLHGITLRDYQVQAIDTMIKAVRGVAWMATNAGKTAVIAGIIASIPYKALVVVNSKELLYQTAEKLQQLVEPNTSICGLVGDSHREFNHRITVATIQTLSKLVDQGYASIFGDSGIVIVDECHHAKAKTFDSLYEIPGTFRFGFSGTPLSYKKLDDLKLIAATGEVRIKLTNQDMITQGVSVQPVIHIHPMHQRNVLKDVEYQEAYRRGIVENIRRNLLISDLATKAAKANQVVLVVVSHIEHGNILYDQIKTQGVYCTFVNGSTAIQKRKQALTDMRSGLPGVYIATSIFDEGVDVAGIETLILAGGGKSDKNTLQRIGRGLRKDQDKTQVKVIDFYDDCCAYLRKHSKERVKLYQKEQFTIEVIK